MCVFAIISLFTSCGKNDEIIAALSESDAVEIIEANLQKNAGGLLTNLEDVAQQLLVAVTSGELCDTLYSKTIEKTFQGAQIQSSYNSDVSYTMACNNLNIPQTVAFSTLTSTLYNSTRISSDDNGNFVGNATGLQPSSLTMMFDVNYNRTGTQVLRFGEQKDITSTLTVNLSALKINKQSYEIESGNGTIVLTGSTAGETFTFNGNIVFNGDNKATLTINGTAYEIDWN